MNGLSGLFSSFGFEILIAVVFGILLATSALDLIFTLVHKPTVGQYVNAAVTTRPWIALIVAVVFGAMIAHFFIYITHP